MGKFLNHEPCPACGSRDNFGRYDDGGGFCFGCHYMERATGVAYKATPASSKGQPCIPDDVGHDFSAACIEWLKSFHVDVPTAIKYGLVWSPSREQLIYQMGNVWQARNFMVGAKSKNFTSGNVNECLHIYGDSDRANVDATSSVRLVIVEDPLSALRIAPWCDAMPLLGSHLATSRLVAIAGLYSSLVFYLDGDKYKESRDMTRRAQYIGLAAHSVYNPKDPKELTNEELKEVLGF